MIDIIEAQLQSVAGHLLMDAHEREASTIIEDEAVTLRYAHPPAGILLWHRSECNLIVKALPQAPQISIGFHANWTGHLMVPLHVLHQCVQLTVCFGFRVQWLDLS